MENLPASLVEQARFSTDLGALFVDDCLAVLRQIPENTLDLVITSPPYDGQPRYGNGEKYERSWYEDTFLKITAEVLRALRPDGSFVLNYRSKRQNGERGTLQYELVLWLKDQGFRFCEDFVGANRLLRQADGIGISRTQSNIAFNSQSLINGSSFLSNA